MEGVSIQGNGVFYPHGASAEQRVEVRALGNGGTASRVRRGGEEEEPVVEGGKVPVLVEHTYSHRDLALVCALVPPYRDCSLMPHPS